jgi:RNA polymerase sigma-70 factor, ECF subfamily
MSDQDWLAAQFDANRLRLRAVAYRMLGSLSEADDAVQESWLRLSRSDANDIENLSAWLTTVVARVCLNNAGLASVPTGSRFAFGAAISARLLQMR